jgi:rhamnose utilization protein RhaD (predicted bifunctional aldolase and dehydrogenase)
MRQEILSFCARIGANPLLIQAGGGNVSWKNGSALHIKASGTWLAHALDKEIFVPVALDPLRRAYAEGDYDAAPRPLDASGLRPSIETGFHVLMPQPVVAHVHAVEAIVHLVQKDAEALLRERLGGVSSWAFCPYYKPGADLARGVAEALREKPDARQIYLQNHGVIVAGETVAEIEQQLRDLVTRLASPPRSVNTPAQGRLAAWRGLDPVPDFRVQALALDTRLCDIVRRHWALYPDHVVFLGARAHFSDEEQAEEADLLFAPGRGVYAARPLSSSQLAYLRGFADVLVRLPETASLISLRASEIAALLDWDAEQYRQSLNANR